jgi:hypothetical protein
VAAKKALYPAEALTRIGSNARWTVGNVTLVGTLLTLFGILGSPTAAGEWARALAYLSTATAFAAVVCAWLYLLVRVDTFNIENLDQVQPWYEKQFGRAKLVVVSSWALLAALILAASAGVLTVIASSNYPVALSAVVQASSGNRELVVAAKSANLDPGDEVTMTIVNPAGRNELVGKVIADFNGSVDLEAVSGADAIGSYQLMVHVNGAPRGALQISVTA